MSVYNRGKLRIKKMYRLNKSLYSYRYLFYIMLIESGLAPETIRLLTDHSLGMTARYSHAQLINLKQTPLLDLYNPQFPQKEVLLQ